MNIAGRRSGKIQPQDIHRKAVAIFRVWIRTLRGLRYPGIGSLSEYEPILKIFAIYVKILVASQLGDLNTWVHFNWHRAVIPDLGLCPKPRDFLRHLRHPDMLTGRGESSPSVGLPARLFLDWLLLRRANRRFAAQIYVIITHGNYNIALPNSTIFSAYNRTIFTPFASGSPGRQSL